MLKQSVGEHFGRCGHDPRKVVKDVNLCFEVGCSRGADTQFMRDDYVFEGRLRCVNWFRDGRHENHLPGSLINRIMWT
jgi:hypothetical protein